MNNQAWLKIIRDSLQDNQKWAVDNLLVLTAGGSHLYGTNLPTSDTDIVGITVEPEDFVIGASSVEQFQGKFSDRKAEFTIFAFRKWLKLFYNQNPNIIEIAFVGQDNPCNIYQSDYWVENIKPKLTQLLSQQAFRAFQGYSTAQLKKAVTKQENKTGRQEIIQRYGIESKFVAHCVRLCEQGKELLTTGKITFPRPNFDSLKFIRENTLGLTQATAIDLMESKITELQDCLKDSVLPKNGDFDVYNNLLKDTFYRFCLHKL